MILSVHEGKYHVYYLLVYVSLLTSLFFSSSFQHSYLVIFIKPNTSVLIDMTINKS